MTAKNNKSIKYGVVVSISGNKTIKVKVSTRKPHPVYKKVVTSSWTTLVHDELNTSKVGDQVNFIECRPLSTKKRFRLITSKGSV